MGGVAPHTTPVRARPPSLGAICAASWRVGAGSLVPRGSCGSRRLGRGVGQRSCSSLWWGEGGPSPLPRGVGAGPARAGGGAGGGGGVASRPPCSPSGCGPRLPTLVPLLSSAHSAPACACGRGRGAAPGWGGMGGGPWTAPPRAPPDLNSPSALPEWALVMAVSWGARLPYCSGAPPCAAPRLGPRAAPARWCGLARWPQPPQVKAAGGAGARGVQVQPHPPPSPRRGPFWGRGGVPSAPGGRRVAPVALKLGGGGGGGGWGGRPTALRPPAPSGVGLPSVVCGVPPRGILVTWGLPGGRGSRARPGRPPKGQCGGGGGGGGGTPQPWFTPPSSLGRPLKGPLHLRRPGRRRSAVGRQRAGRAGACLGRGARAPRMQRPPRGGCGAAVSSVCPRPLLGLRGRGGEVGGGPLVPRRRPLGGSRKAHGHKTAHPRHKRQPNPPARQHRIRDPPKGHRRTTEAGSDPRGHLWVSWGVYLCAGKPPLADIILSHPPDLT